VKVTHQVIVPQNVRIGEADIGLRPESRPPVGVRGEGPVVAGFQGRRHALAGHVQRIRAIAVGRDRDRQQGLLRRAPAGDADAVLQVAGRFLDEPLGRSVAARPGGRITERGHGVAVRPGAAAAAARNAHTNLLRLRTRNAGQCDGLRRAEEDIHLAAAGQPGAALGRGQVQLEPLDLLRRIQRQLQPARRDLGRRGVTVRRVRQAADLGLILLADQLLQVGVREPRLVDLRRRPQVPEIAAVERQTDGVPLAPKQPAEQSVAQRNGLVPGGDRRG